jgi:hypothetical protein
LSLLRMTTSEKVLILLDADVIIHLFKADKITLLNELYKGRLRMLDIVLAELLNNRTINKIIENPFRFKQIEEITFPTISNPAMFSEYIKLKSTIKEDGERACLLYCKYFKQIIASSNTSDIVPFCEENNIAYLTTLDILTVAIERGKISKKEADECIKLIFDKGSYACCHSIEEHGKKHFKREKLLY